MSFGYIRHFLFLNWVLYHLTELQEFRQIIDDFIKIAETIVAEVEDEKLHAIGAQNILKSMAKQKETRQQDVQVIN